MQLNDLVLTSKLVADTSGRLEKIALLAALLKRLAPNEVPIAVGFLTGWPRQGKLGVGWASVAEARPATSATTPELTLADVDEAFTRLQSIRGKQSAAERKRLLSDLFSRSTSAEQSFLAALAIGEVRQGALDGILTEAVARAASLPADRVRRAAMLAGDLGTVAEAVLAEGEAGLARYGLQLFRPVQLAFGRLRRTHDEFAARHDIARRASSEQPEPGHPSQGVKGFLEAAIDAITAADLELATLQDSMLPVEVGDPELRAGLAAVRSLVEDVRTRSREVLRTLGR